MERWKRGSSKVSYQIFINNQRELWSSFLSPSPVGPQVFLYYLTKKGHHLLFFTAEMKSTAKWHFLSLRQPLPPKEAMKTYSGVPHAEWFLVPPQDGFTCTDSVQLEASPVLSAAGSKGAKWGHMSLGDSVASWSTPWKRCDSCLHHLTHYRTQETHSGERLPTQGKGFPLRKALKHLFDIHVLCLWNIYYEVYFWA